MSGPCRSRAFAMALFLVVLMVMTVIASSLAFTALAQAEASSRAAATAAGRALAVSGIEEAYARLATDSSFLTKAQDGTSGHPAFGSGSWAELDAGVPRACPDLSAACYHLESRVQLDASGRPLGAVLEASVRTRCRGTADSCVVTRMQQRLRTRQFFDYMFATTFTTLPPTQQPSGFQSGECAVRAALRPAGCLDPAYAAGDVVRGPLYTADDRILVCASPAGSPSFQGPVSVSGPGYRGRVWQPSSTVRTDELSCGSPSAMAFSFGDTGVRAPVLEFPDVGFVDQAKASPYSTPDLRLEARSVSVSPQPDDPPAQCVGDGSSQAYAVTDVATGPVVIEFGPGGQFTASGVRTSLPATQLAVCADYQPDPDTGEPIAVSTVMGADIPVTQRTVPLAGAAVITVERATQVQVRGTIPAGVRVSLVTDAPVVVTGSLRYADGAAAPVTIAALISQEPIVVLQDTLGPGSPLTVHAILVSPLGGVFTLDWNKANAAAAASRPLLTLYGAVASRFQSVFGGYQAANGQLASGYVKDFSFDSRPSRGSSTPPFFPAPKDPSWARVDLAEVPPCKDASAEPWMRTYCGQ